VSNALPSVLVVRLDAIGDALTVVPLIAALRTYGMRIGAVLRPANAQAFSHRALDRVHLAGGDWNSLVAEIAAERYDYALIATEKPQAYRLAYCARIPHRIGFENGWGKPFKTLWVRRLCTHTVFRTAGLDPHAPHECDVVYSLARGIVPDAQAPRDSALLRPLVIDEEPPSDSRAAMQITSKWERLGATRAQVLDLARRIRERVNVRFFCAQSEAQYGESIAAEGALHVEYFDALAPWKAAIASVRAIVAPDSGAVHVAGMTGTPVAACFASADFALQTARWAPWAAPYETVKMEGAWPIVAVDAFTELLEGTPQRSYTG
jgi:ADP-heptose:LPS heptosyltransferase